MDPQRRSTRNRLRLPDRPSFYGGFVGVDRDPLRDATSPTFTVGNAIHAGYRHAAAARTAGADAETAARAYHDAVARTWADDFAHLLLDRPSGRPKALHRRPLAAREMILERLAAFHGHDEAERALLQERLFFAPGRGISGRADRLVYRHGNDDEDGAVESLHEIKTGGGFGAEKIPLTDVPRPGGLQALAYREIVRALGADPETYVEAIEDDLAHELPLEITLIVRRARARIADGGNDRALDLLAQSRNIGFLATSGLLTGYDRYRIDTIAGIGRRIRGLGGDWSLEAPSPPPARFASPLRAPRIGAHHQSPDRQLLATCRRNSTSTGSGSTASYKTRSAPAAKPSTTWSPHPSPPSKVKKGLSIGSLIPRGSVPRGAGLLTLARDERIETRLREDDRILVTPADRAPGELLSVEGTLRAVGAHEVTVELRDSPPPSKSRRYRLDQLPFRSPWQVQGLTDFLIVPLGRGRQRPSTARGRTARPRAPHPRRGRTHPAHHRRQHPRHARSERRPAPRARCRAQPRPRRPPPPGATRHRQDLHHRHPRPRHRPARLLRRPRRHDAPPAPLSSPTPTAPPTKSRARSPRPIPTSAPTSSASAPPAPPPSPRSAPTSSPSA